MVDVSFVVPAYNSEKTLEAMLSSVLKSRMEFEAEVIVINDGSTDGTEQLLEKIAQTDRRIRILTAEVNQGQSSARNAGIQKAKGKYIFFADSDDEVLMDGVNSLFHTAEDRKADIVCGKYILCRGGIEWKEAEPSGLEAGKIEKGSRLYDLFKTRSAFGYIWNKLYRKEFLIENTLCFDATIRVFMEDQLFNLKAFSCSPHYYLTEDVVYRYHSADPLSARKADRVVAKKSVDMLQRYLFFLRETGKFEENRDLYVLLTNRMMCWAAFRNLEKDGRSFPRIYECLRIFSKAECVQTMVRDRSNRKFFSAVESKKQKYFYRLSFLLVREGQIWLLALLFVLLSRPMYSAIVRDLK